MPNKIEQLEDGKKLKVELETGEVFEGDPIEVTNKMAAAHVSTKKWGQEWKAKAEAPPVVTPPPVTPNANAEELQLQKYLLEQTAKGLGYNSAEEYKADLAKVKSVTERQANQAVAADFIQQCPDFPNSEASIEALKTKMEKMGYDYTPQSMIAAHMLCLREEAYKPLSVQDQNETWANRMAASGRGNPAPMIRSNSPEQAQTIDLYKEDLNAQRARIIKEQLAERGM